MVLRRYWKNYPEDPRLDSKVLVFYEYPPESRGTAFMVWTYKVSTGKPEDMWLYLPLLRKVQKVPVHPDEIFSGANLRPADMLPRPPELDSHRLLREETIENQAYYVIESVPKRFSPHYPYSKVIKWISKDRLLKERIDYFDRKGHPLKRQIITWKRVGKAWTWEKVILENLQNGVQTRLSISEIRINTGIPDRIFTRRTMQSGRVIF